MTATHDSKKAADNSSQGKIHKDGSQPLVESTVETAAPLVARRAMDNPAALTPANVMALQRTVGNAAVQRILAGRGQPQTPSIPFGVRLNTGQVIQPKLTVGPANDQYEEEADDIARQVVGTANTPGVQRAAQSHGQPQIGQEGGHVDQTLESRIRGSQGGSSLPAAVRSQLEPKLGTDLHSVKVHTDSHAADLNRQLGA